MIGLYGVANEILPVSMPVHKSMAVAAQIAPPRKKGRKP